MFALIIITVLYFTIGIILVHKADPDNFDLDKVKLMDVLKWPKTLFKD